RVCCCGASANSGRDERNADLTGETRVAIVAGRLSTLTAIRISLCEERQIILCGFEHIEETILEYVHLVVVVLPPQPSPVRADIANFDGSVPVQLALEAKRIRLRVARLEVRIKVINAGRASCKQWEPAGVCRRSDEGVSAGITEEHAPRLEDTRCCCRRDVQVDRGPVVRAEHAGVCIKALACVSYPVAAAKDRLIAAAED